MHFSGSDFDYKNKNQKKKSKAVKKLFNGRKYESVGRLKPGKSGKKKHKNFGASKTKKEIRFK